MLNIVFCVEKGEIYKNDYVTIRMTRQVNLFHMLKVLCCRVEGGKLNMAQDESKWQFWGWSDTVGVKQHNEIWS